MSQDMESSGGERKPQPKEMKHYLELLADHGMDFEASDLEHLDQMSEDELTEYFYQALLEAGIDDPEGFMVEHGLVEGFRALSTAEFNARNSLTRRGEGYSVDELDSSDA